MEVNFVSAVAKALELVRKGDVLALSKHDLARLTIVRRELAPEDPPTRAGRFVETTLKDLLTGRVRPAGPEDLDRVDWRRYTLLDRYVFRHQSMDDIAKDLRIGQALFFQTKKDAVEVLANELWAAEQRVKQEVDRQLENIPRTHFDFIPRAAADGTDLIELIVAGLNKRPWVVSIRGFGGVGKTTLAIEGARAAVNRGLFDRVLWVEVSLDNAASPDLVGRVLDTMGKALGIRKVLGLDEITERRQLVFGRLREVKSLVVIDSLENVPNQTHEEVIGLVRDLPLPTGALLVSREMARKTELETMIHLEGMHQGEAIRFLSARADEHGVQVEEQQAQYLYQVTRGNPRAMLWALAWMAKFGLPAEDVLVPEMPEMSQLLDHLLGRIYEKLDQDEETVVNVMPLFAELAPWPAIAAAAGLADEPVRVKAALGSLHSRFLVEVSHDQRYSIEPITRMYLQDNAMKPGGRIAGQSARDFRSEAHARLVDHYIDELEKAIPHQRLEFVRGQRQTIIEALSWSLANEQDRRLTHLILLVGRSLGELGYLRDKLEWGESAMEAARKIGDLKRAAWHRIFDVGWTLIQRGNYEDGAAVTKQGLAEATDLDYAEAESIALLNLGTVTMQEKEYARAMEYFERSANTAKQHNLIECLGLAKTALGEAKLQVGRPREARQLFEEVLLIYEDLGDSKRVSISLSQLAHALLTEGYIDRATELLDRALALARAMTDPSRAYARALWTHAILQQEQGRIEDALRSFRHSLDIYNRLGKEISAQRVRALLEHLTQDEG